MPGPAVFSSGRLLHKTSKVYCRCRHLGDSVLHVRIRHLDYTGVQGKHVVKRRQSLMREKWNRSAGTPEKRNWKIWYASLTQPSISVICKYCDSTQPNISAVCKYSSVFPDRVSKFDNPNRFHRMLAPPKRCLSTQPSPTMLLTAASHQQLDTVPMLQPI